MSISREFEKLARQCALAAANTDEIVYLNGLVKERLRSLQYSAARKFRKGDQVQFKSTKSGVIVTGVVEKVNQKTVDVLSRDHGRWRVTSGLLRAA